MATHVDVVYNDWERSVQRRVAALVSDGSYVAIHEASSTRVRSVLTDLIASAHSIDEARAVIVRETEYLVTESHAASDCMFLSGAVRPMQRLTRLVPLGASGGAEDLQPVRQPFALRIAK